MFDEITEILRDMTVICNTEATTYQEDEDKSSLTPFIVLTNQSVGSEYDISNCGSIDTESFRVDCYDINRPLAKNLATKVKDKLRFTKTGTANQIVLERVELQGGTVRYENGLYAQSIRVFTRIPN